MVQTSLYTPHSPQTPVTKLSSVHSTPEQTAIDTDSSDWTPSTTTTPTKLQQETELQGGGKGRELMEPLLLRQKERQLVVEDVSADNGGRNSSTGGRSGSATALDMHDSTTNL